MKIMSFLNLMKSFLNLMKSPTLKYDIIYTNTVSRDIVITIPSTQRHSQRGFG